MDVYVWWGEEEGDPRNASPSPAHQHNKPPTPNPTPAQVAVVFSKGARFDFPRAWPSLFSDLLAKLQVGRRGGGTTPRFDGAQWHHGHSSIGITGQPSNAVQPHALPHASSAPSVATAAPAATAAATCRCAPQGPNQLVQRRVYLVLHHILKELASKRLAADQRNFEQARGGQAPLERRGRAATAGRGCFECYELVPAAAACMRGCLPLSPP